MGVWQVLDKYEYDGPSLICGHDPRLFQKQVFTLIKYLKRLAKKTVCIYDDKGQVGKSDFIDVIVSLFAALVFDDGNEKAVLDAIRDAFANSREFRKQRIIIFNLTRESPLYACKLFSQLLEKITDGSFLGGGGWEERFPWVFVIGNWPITHTATTASNGGRILFYKLNSETHKLVFAKDLAKKVAALSEKADGISAVTDEAAETGEDAKVIAFKRIFERSGDKATGDYLEYDEVINLLADRYPKLFNEYRKWGKVPGKKKEGKADEDWVYQKTPFHNFFLTNFAGKIEFSNQSQNWAYHVKVKKA